MAGIQVVPGYEHIKPGIEYTNNTNPYMFTIYSERTVVGNPFTGRVENEEYVYSEYVDKVFYLNNPQGNSFQFEFYILDEKGELPVNLNVSIMFKPDNSAESILKQYISGTYQPGAFVESDNMGGIRGLFIIKVGASLVFNNPHKDVYPMAAVSTI